MLQLGSVGFIFPCHLQIIFPDLSHVFIIKLVQSTKHAKYESCFQSLILFCIFIFNFKSEKVWWSGYLNLNKVLLQIKARSLLSKLRCLSFISKNIFLYNKMVKTLKKFQKYVIPLFWSESCVCVCSNLFMP